MSGQPAYNGNVLNVREVWYTGKNINATAASRTDITTALAVGQVLVRDPYGHDNGEGLDYTQPQTSFLHEAKVVIVNLPPKTRLTGEGYGRWVGVVDLAPSVDALVDGDTVDVAAGNLLAVTNGSFNLTKLANTTALTDASVDTVGELLNVVAASGACGIALEANTGAAALKKIKFNGCGPF